MTEYQRITSAFNPVCRNCTAARTAHPRERLCDGCLYEATAYAMTSGMVCDICHDAFELAELDVYAGPSGPFYAVIAGHPDCVQPYRELYEPAS